MYGMLQEENLSSTGEGRSRRQHGPDDHCLRFGLLIIVLDVVSSGTDRTPMSVAKHLVADIAEASR